MCESGGLAFQDGESINIYTEKSTANKLESIGLIFSHESKLLKVIEEISSKVLNQAHIKSPSYGDQADIDHVKKLVENKNKKDKSKTIFYISGKSIENQFFTNILTLVNFIKDSLTGYKRTTGGGDDEKKRRKRRQANFDYLDQTLKIFENPGNYPTSRFDELKTNLLSESGKIRKDFVEKVFKAGLQTFDKNIAVNNHPSVLHNAAKDGELLIPKNDRGIRKLIEAFFHIKKVELAEEKTRLKEEQRLLRERKELAKKYKIIVKKFLDTKSEEVAEKIVSRIKTRTLENKVAFLRVLREKNTLNANNIFLKMWEANKKLDVILENKIRKLKRDEEKRKRKEINSSSDDVLPSKSTVVDDDTRNNELSVELSPTPPDRISFPFDDSLINTPVWGVDETAGQINDLSINSEQDNKLLDTQTHDKKVLSLTKTNDNITPLNKDTPELSQIENEIKHDSTSQNPSNADTSNLNSNPKPDIMSEKEKEDQVKNQKINTPPTINNRQLDTNSELPPPAVNDPQIDEQNLI